MCLGVGCLVVGCCVAPCLAPGLAVDDVAPCFTVEGFESFLAVEGLTAAAAFDLVALCIPTAAGHLHFGVTVVVGRVHVVGFAAGRAAAAGALHGDTADVQTVGLAGQELGCLAGVHVGFLIFRGVHEGCTPGTVGAHWTGCVTVGVPVFGAQVCAAAGAAGLHPDARAISLTEPEHEEAQTVGVCVQGLGCALDGHAGFCGWEAGFGEAGFWQAHAG